MDHKYKALLQNIPTRHVITAIMSDASERADQIKKLRNLDINNFFILGSLSSIKSVLGKKIKIYLHSQSNVLSS